ncbi:MAG: hypothetical protein K8R74_15780 [Bacteroidales bacterium]|nr:hypothetical protein [Bacteroidales bacterium]
MAANIGLSFSKLNTRSIVIDILALAFIYFVPTISHLLNVPIYLVEPMRIMLILAIAHTTKKNAYIIALTLPLFSFLISSHPNIFKAVIMTMELVLNVWLFYELAKRANQFVAMLSSIILSKIFYYLLKFGLISFAVLQTDLISTPIYLQIITSLVFSGYLFFIIRRNQINTAD